MISLFLSFFFWHHHNWRLIWFIFSGKSNRFQMIFLFKWPLFRLYTSNKTHAFKIQATLPVYTCARVHRCTLFLASHSRMRISFRPERLVADHRRRRSGQHVWTPNDRIGRGAGKRARRPRRKTKVFVGGKTASDGAALIKRRKRQTEIALDRTQCALHLTRFIPPPTTAWLAAAFIFVYGPGAGGAINFFVAEKGPRKPTTSVSPDEH